MDNKKPYKDKILKIINKIKQLKEPLNKILHILIHFIIGIIYLMVGIMYSITIFLLMITTVLGYTITKLLNNDKWMKNLLTILSDVCIMLDDYINKLINDIK